jgi:hypothetical protein
VDGFVPADIADISQVVDILVDRNFRLKKEKGTARVP